MLTEGEIIMIYDKASHVAVEPQYSADSVDQRWVLIERPVVMVGGEMTLKSLDLDFNAISKFYEAPLQMKANNGLFIVDDFGRQQVDPAKFFESLDCSPGTQDRLSVFSHRNENRNSF